MGPNERAYRDSRLRIATLVAKLEVPQLNRRVAACPGWRVHDVVAHLTGVAADVTAGNLEGAPADAWTAAQVAARRHLPMSEILAEWTVVAARLEPQLDQGPPGHAGTVADIATHEQDLRSTLGLPGGRDSAAAAIALDTFVRMLGRRLRDHRVPALRLRAGDREWVAGDGEPAATVVATPFELTRALSGRRSPAQLQRLGWDGDPRPWLDVFAAFPVRTRPLEE